MSGRLWPIVLVSGALGYLAGAWDRPTWQDAIEPAQVLAGLVAYPADNPVYLYSTRTWTLLHQVIALFLRAGVSEYTLAIAVSGATGACSFVALALTARAIGAPAAWAALAPLVIHFTGAARFSPGYPVLLVGFPFTYGLVSHALALMVLALAGLGRLRAAAFLLGLLPAIHPGVGALMWLVAGLTMLITGRWREIITKTTVSWGMAGLGLTLISAGVHVLWFAPNLAGVPLPGDELLRSVRRYWDGHRQPLAFHDPSVRMAVVVPVLMLLWQQWQGRQWSRDSRTVAVALTVAAAIALGADILLRVLPEDMVFALARPMPIRLLVLPLMAAAAWAVGAATRTGAPERLRQFIAWLGALLALLCVVRLAGQLDLGLDVRRLIDAVLSRVPMLLVWAVTLASAFLVSRVPAARAAGRRVCAASVALLVITFLAAAWTARGVRSDAIPDRTNDAVLAAAASRSGLLLTSAELHLIQAATRRPILVDPGAIDALPYVPEAAAVADEIFREVFGLSLAAPPTYDGAPQGTLPWRAGEQLWVVRTVEDWQQIRERFGVTEILAGAHLPLQLSVAARNDRWTLWEIPAR